MCDISAEKNEVCEEFIGFTRLEKLDAQTIVDTLLHALQECGFNMSGLVGQGYDGESSSRNGVQAKVGENGGAKVQVTGHRSQATGYRTDRYNELSVVTFVRATLGRVLVTYQRLFSD